MLLYIGKSDYQAIGVLIVIAVGIIYMIIHRIKFKKETDTIVKREMTNEEAAEEEIAYNKDLIRQALSDQVPDDQVEDVIEKIFNESENIPGKYIKYRYPIERWETLSKEEMEAAQDEWLYLATMITDDHYRMNFMLVKMKGDELLCWAYVELRYSGGFPEKEALYKVETTVMERMEKRRYKTRDDVREALSAEVKKALEEIPIGVTVNNILINITK
ncbi:MAG: hypothetical protein IKH46_15025 [Lachnospiraceae bacterium]|nr:hypothetical protein [Lachnospiraceae bacterium]